MVCNYRTAHILQAEFRLKFSKRNYRTCQVYLSTERMKFSKRKVERHNSRKNQRPIIVLLQKYPSRIA